MSVIYVDDCVRGILEGARHENSIGKGYFLTHDKPVTWAQFQSEVVRAVDRPVRTLDLPEQVVLAGALGGELASRLDKKPRLLNLQKAKMGAQQAWTCVGDAARRDFGFSAEIEIEEGIRLTHEWYQANDWYRSFKPRELLSPRSLRGLARRLRRFR